MTTVSRREYICACHKLNKLKEEEKELSDIIKRYEKIDFAKEINEMINKLAHCNIKLKSHIFNRIRKSDLEKVIDVDPRDVFKEDMSKLTETFDDMIHPYVLMQPTDEFIRIMRQLPLVVLLDLYSSLYENDRHLLGLNHE